MSRLRGIVISYDDRNAYGFIRPDADDGGPPLFLHVSQLSDRAQRVDLRPGAAVEYEPGILDNRLAPVRVAVLVEPSTERTFDPDESAVWRSP